MKNYMRDLNLWFSDGCIRYNGTYYNVNILYDKNRCIKSKIYSIPAHLIFNGRRYTTFVRLTYNRDNSLRDYIYISGSSVFNHVFFINNEPFYDNIDKKLIKKKRKFEYHSLTPEPFEKYFRYR